MISKNQDKATKPQTVQIVWQGEATLYWFSLIHYIVVSERSDTKVRNVRQRRWLVLWKHYILVSDSRKKPSEKDASDATSCNADETTPLNRKCPPEANSDRRCVKRKPCRCWRFHGFQPSAGNSRTPYQCPGAPKRPQPASQAKARPVHQ